MLGGAGVAREFAQPIRILGWKYIFVLRAFDPVAQAQPRRRDQRAHRAGADFTERRHLKCVQPEQVN